MKWEDFVKRYVWDDVKTPFFVRPSRLTRQQADYELLAYSGFLGVLFAFAAIVTIPARGGSDASMLFSIYAFTMTCGAVVLHFAKSLLVARYSASAPFAIVVYFTFFESAPTLHSADYLALGVGCLLWAVYALRVIAVVRRYPEMAPPAPGSPAASGRRR